MTVTHLESQKVSAVDDELKAQVRSTQLLNLWKAAAGIAGGNAAMAIIGALFLQLTGSGTASWYWASAVLLHSAVRWRISRSVRASDPNNLRSATLELHASALSFTSALFFAYFCVVYATALAAGTIFALSLSSTVPTLGLSRRVYSSFSIPLGLILLAHFALQGGLVGWTLAVAVPVWVFTFNKFAADFRQQDASVRLRELEIRNLLDVVQKQQRLTLQAEEQARMESHAKSRFLNMLSHDVRQPLDAVQLWHAALSELPLSAEAQRCLNAAESGRTELSRMFDALLDLSLIESGTLKPTHTSARLSALFDSLRNTFEPVAAARDILLRIDADEGLTVQTDEVMLMRILRNLVANALEHVTSGSVSVTARRVGDTGSVQIDVTDTGCGIADETKKHLFSEFYRGETPVSSRPAHPTMSAHLGLGLYIVKVLAKKIDAQIEVASTVGKGSSFSVLLGPTEVLTR